MRAIMKSAVEWARARAEKGEPLDAERTLELLESHENLRSAYEDALRRATGHAYATGMAEAGEELQQQQLESERKSHAETLVELRRYEGALHRIAKWPAGSDANPREIAMAALNEGEGRDG